MPSAAAAYDAIIRTLSRADGIMQSLTPIRTDAELEQVLAEIPPLLESFTRVVRDYLIEDAQRNASDLRQLLDWQIALSTGIFGSLIAAFFLSILQNRRLVRANGLISRASEQYQHLAHHDPLTGLANRRYVQNQVERLFATGTRNADTVAVACFDIDRFKQINDTLGHGVGDSLVRQFAERLCSALPRNMPAILGRQGGDEFVLVLPFLQSAFDMIGFAHAVQKTLSEKYRPDGHDVVISTSIGLAIGPLAGAEWTPLLTKADLALKNAKERGRDQVAVYENGMIEEVVTRHQIEQELRHALARQQLEVHYQPIVTLSNGRTAGLEALVRWRHPVLGMISPARFVPIAEETGLISEIGEWVLRTACGFAASLPAEIQMSVNISASQMLRDNIGETVHRILSETGLPGERLVVELTESVMLDNEKRFAEMFTALKAMNVSLALDDFGTGFSSLAYLRRYRFERLKIDRSFVADVERDSEARVLVRSIIAMARALSMNVTAEGVESAGQALLLTADGCQTAQGYFFARPQPAESCRPRCIIQASAWQEVIAG